MTEVIMRQRGQITIPHEIVERAGLEPGMSMDLHYVENGTIVIRLAGHHDSVADILRRYAGIGKGIWGDTDEEVEATIRRQREEGDRPDTWERIEAEAAAARAERAEVAG